MVRSKKWPPNPSSQRTLVTTILSRHGETVTTSMYTLMDRQARTGTKVANWPNQPQHCTSIRPPATISPLLLKFERVIQKIARISSREIVVFKMYLLIEIRVKSVAIHMLKTELRQFQVGEYEYKPGFHFRLFLCMILRIFYFSQFPLSF